MAREELADHSERREHPRYTVDIAVDIQVGKEVISGLMVDISIDGLRLSLPTLVTPETEMLVSFTAVDEVKIFARAVWTLEKSLAGLPAYLVGLKIDAVLVDNQDLPGMAERTAFLDRLLR